MNEQTNTPQELTQTPTKQALLKDVEAVRDLFARAHDYIAQATYPGHMGTKVAEVLNFLSFQYNDFKLRGERMTKAIEDEKNIVDVPAAKAVVDAVLSDKPAQTQSPETVNE